MTKHIKTDGIEIFTNPHSCKGKEVVLRTEGRPDDELKLKKRIIEEIRRKANDTHELSEFLEDTEKYYLEDILQKEKFDGECAAKSWLESASVHAIHAATTRRTTEELKDAYMKGEKVEIISPLLGNDEIGRFFRGKYESSAWYFAEEVSFPVVGVFPNILFRAFEEGWTKGVRNSWDHQILITPTSVTE